jgi:hypothetical protein
VYSSHLSPTLDDAYDPAWQKGT